MGFRGFIGYAKTGRYVGALVVLLCLWAQAAVAQNPIADSLLKQLRGETVDTNRVQLLRQLSYAYRTSEPDLALQYARNGRQLASLIDYPLGEAACLNSVGAAYMSVGNLPKALESFLAALQLNEQRGSQYGTAANLGNIGRVYALQGDFKAANRYGFRSRRLFEAIHDTSNVTMQLLNMGGNYAELGKPDSAMYYTQLGYARARQEDSKANLIISLNNLGVLYSRQNRNELALWSYQQAVPYCVELNQIEYLCTDYFNIAEVSGLLGRPDTLLHYGRRSLALAQRSGINNSVLDASALLSNYFEQQHRPDSAFRYLKLAAAANDSLHNQDRVQHVQQLTFAEKIRQQELREAREQAEGNRRYNLQLLAIAVFIFTVRGAAGAAQPSVGPHPRGRGFGAGSAADALRVYRAAGRTHHPAVFQQQPGAATAGHDAAGPHAGAASQPPGALDEKPLAPPRRPRSAKRPALMHHTKNRSIDYHNDKQIINAGYYNFNNACFLP